jgi:hypothetical protein
MLSRHSSKFAIAIVLVGTVASATHGQNFVDDHIAPTTLQVVRIEEDWRLQVGDPDPNVTAPQVTTAISPRGDLEGVHAIFNLNHQALEQFAPGGMQLQVWNGETPISHYRLNPDEVFSDSGEVVTWTQVMELKSSGLLFRIENGQSATWGSFGGNALLTERVSTTLSNLNAYNPLVSVDNSGVVFAGNRVQSLKLERVRIFTSDGQEFSIELNMGVDHE